MSSGHPSLCSRLSSWISWERAWDKVQGAPSLGCMQVVLRFMPHARSFTAKSAAPSLTATSQYILGRKVLRGYELRFNIGLRFGRRKIYIRPLTSKLGTRLESGTGCLVARTMCSGHDTIIRAHLKSIKAFANRSSRDARTIRAVLREGSMGRAG